MLQPLKVVVGFLCIGLWSCSLDQTKPASSPLDLSTLNIKSVTDSRDGENYKVVTIGKQIWLAENLRYAAAGSRVNPDNPSKTYGRLYDLTSAQTACIKGWHLPSDAEWDILEMAHGMPASFIGKSGWRGEHAPSMRSSTEWGEKGDGTNSLNFNILPAGYYASGKMGLPQGLEGLGYSAAFWSSIKNEVATARFMFDVRKFINKWDDTNNDSGVELSCRCIMD